MALFSISNETLSDDIINNFLDAVREKNEARINELITEETVRQRDKFGHTLLHIVAKEGTVETAIRLLDLGANIHVRNNKMKTPIFYALRNSLNMVKLLSEKRKSFDWNLLSPAFLFASIETVYYLLNQGLIEIQQQIKKLNLFPIDKHSTIDEMMRALLQHKFYLYDQYLLDIEKNYTYLIFFAAKIGRKDIFNMIIKDCKAMINLRKDDERELIFRGYSSETPLHFAVREQLPNAVEFLLKEGADPNVKTQDFLTPLHYAAVLKNAEICQILLNYNADVNPNQSYYMNPLNMVCGSNNAVVFQNSSGYYDDVPCYSNCRLKPIFDVTIMKMLLDSGADTECENLNGMTPLLDACKEGRFKEVEILLKYDAYLRAKSYSRTSTLHFAVDANSLDIVQLLLEKGLDVDTRNERDETPLMHAVTNNNDNLEMIGLLIDRGADIDATSDNFGVFYLAVSSFSYTVIEYLLESGADWSINFSFIFLDPLIHKKVRKFIIAYIALTEDNFIEHLKIYRDSHYEETRKAAKYFRKAKIEIENLKSTLISHESTITYFDILYRDFYSVVKIFKNEEIRRTLSSQNYREQFPYYSLLFDCRLKKIEVLEKYIDKIMDFFLNYGNVQLPIIVVDQILQYLGPINFNFFGKILSEGK